MKTFIRYLGYLLIISAFFRIVPIVTALFYGESFMGFVLVALLSLGLGGLLVWVTKYWKQEKELGLTLSGGLMLAALSFILLPLIGAISYLPSLNYSYIDAVFESVSGFTTTGITVYESLDLLPKGLLMWRAMTQWIGGIGIVMVFLFIITRLHSHDYIRLSEVEGSAKTAVSLYQAQGFTEKLGGGLRTSVTHVMMIYFGYTLLGILLLLLVGLSPFEAIALTFTALSTGGFSVSDAFYSQTTILSVLSLLMILGSISFFAHNKLLQKKWKEFFFSFEKNIFFLFLLIAIATTLLVVPNVKEVIFMMISAFTTSGYALSPMPLLPTFFIVMIGVGMMIGGSFASTSGGIKVYRIYYLLRAIPWSIKKLSSPTSAVIPLKVHGQDVDEVKLANIGIFIFAYIFILLFGIVLFMIHGHTFMDGSFQMISALGTVGLQSMTITPLTPVLKVILMLAMLLGRLEIFPILILIRNAFK